MTLENPPKVLELERTKRLGFIYNNAEKFKKRFGEKIAMLGQKHRNEELILIITLKSLI